METFSKLKYFFLVSLIAVVVIGEKKEDKCVSSYGTLQTVNPYFSIINQLALPLVLFFLNPILAPVDEDVLKLPWQSLSK